MINENRQKVRGIISGRLPVYFSLLVALILLISIAPLYLTYASKLKNQIMEINSSLLSQTQGGLDQLLQEIDRTSLKLSEDINMKRYIFMTKNTLFSDEQDRQLLLRRVFDVMNNEERYYTNTTSMYVYVKQANIVVTSSQAIPLKKFLERDFVSSVSTSNSKKNWTGIRQSRLTQVHGKPVVKDVLTFYRIISNDGVVTDAILFIDVGIDLLNNFFRDFKSEYPLILLVADSYGNPVYSNQKHLKLSDQEINDLFKGEYGESDYIISQIFSDYNKWTYIFAVPRTWLFSSMKFISHITFLLTVVVLLFGLFVSYLFTNLKYRKVVEENRGMLKNRVLLDILKNNHWQESEIIPIDLKREGGRYMVSCLFLDDTQELNERDKGLVLFAASNILQEILLRANIDTEVAMLDDRCFAVISYSSQSEDSEVMTMQLMEAKGILSDYLKCSWTMGIGNIYEEFSNISKSYREGMTALHHRIYFGKGSAIPFNKLDLDGNLPIHDDEWLRCKEKMVTAIRTKDETNLKLAIQELCERIQGFTGVPMSHVQYIFHSMLLDFEKLVRELNIDKRFIFTEDQSIYALMDQCETLIELEEILKRIGIKIIQFLKSKSFSVKSSLMLSITDFIQLHYRDNIGLENIADRFGINPSYLGQLMKKELNYTFLQYITELRLRKGKELLAQTNVKIHEIGEKIGYPNRSTFIRVFKNSEGVTPTDYRNRLMSSSNGEYTEES